MPVKSKESHDFSRVEDVKDETLDDHDYSYILLKNEIPEGWWKAFGELLCEDIQTELEKYNYVNDFRIVDAKKNTVN